MDHHHARRNATAFVVVLFAVLSFAVPVTADTPLGHRGRYGVHFLADSQEYPGAGCAYGEDNTLAGVRVRDPFVFARDRTPERDRQRVAWRFIVQELAGPTAEWTDIARSRFQRGVAWDDQVADFHPMGRAFDTAADARYRVKVRMYWLAPGKVRPGIDGVATHLVDWYRTPIDEANAGFCPGAIL